MQANFREEKKLWKEGYKYVAGLDEAGRGPLAGPVVAAAVIVLNPKSKILNPKPRRRTSSLRGRQIQNSKFKFSKRVLNFGHLNFDIVLNLGFRILNLRLRDSKKLSPLAREKLYKILTRCPGIKWGIGKVSEKVIDKINIKNAAELAMWRALKNLEKKIKKRTDFLIIDGNNIKNLQLTTYNLKLLIKADEKVFSCATASIIAKVTRDRIMRKYHKKYPQYGFDRHKGYGTKLHLKMLKKHGPCKIHRKSFKPVKISSKIASNS